MKSAHAEGRDQEAPFSTSPPATRAPGGNETILIVDDNNEVRSAASRLLQRSGYRVIEAADGAEALEIARKRSGEIALIVTDVMMPKLGGRALYDALQDLEDGPRFLFCSGYLRPEELEDIEQAGGVNFLPKPWNASDLTHAVRKALDGAAPSRG